MMPMISSTKNPGPMANGGQPTPDPSPPLVINRSSMTWPERIASWLCRRWWRLPYWGTLHLIGRYSSHTPGLRPEELRALLLVKVWRAEVLEHGGKAPPPPFDW